MISNFFNNCKCKYLGNYFTPYLSCGKLPVTGYSWKLKMLGDVIYQSDAQRFSLVDDWVSMI